MLRAVLDGTSLSHTKSSGCGAISVAVGAWCSIASRHGGPFIFPLPQSLGSRGRAQIRCPPHAVTHPGAGPDSESAATERLEVRRGAGRDGSNDALVALLAFLSTAPRMHSWTW
ncbi:hypothetical protein GSI_11323 [Ganoderma sinense ZZ0214-1]|uniref:Uncharacterized protein n=1 Tax=Ganoderma sinense ZZ0214-1 TaxID=1077348 RepID=A0A2G8RVM4_9APHY|nr:hypothetical protein GSI_11323 [Ganoderma sinense ZZ0214-1]